ncbi:unnamed protein product [Closterium sp. NIES-65]|nr:unnamed protein product [Closterium sp. NIES-65]
MTQAPVGRVRLVSPLLSTWYPLPCLLSCSGHGSGERMPSPRPPSRVRRGSGERTPSPRPPSRVRRGSGERTPSPLPPSRVRRGFGERTPSPRPPSRVRRGSVERMPSPRPPSRVRRGSGERTPSPRPPSRVRRGSGERMPSPRPPITSAPVIWRAHAVAASRVALLTQIWRARAAATPLAATLVSVARRVLSTTRSVRLHRACLCRHARLREICFCCFCRHVALLAHVLLPAVGAVLRRIAVLGLLRGVRRVAFFYSASVEVSLSARKQSFQASPAPPIFATAITCIRRAIRSRLLAISQIATPMARFRPPRITPHHGRFRSAGSSLCRSFLSAFMPERHLIRPKGRPSRRSIWPPRRPLQRPPTLAGVSAP